MKIVVYNYQDQYALSRSQVEKIVVVLPKEYIAPIHEFHLTYDEKKPEVFEFVAATKVTFFAFPVKKKGSEVLSKAVEELLVGLARIKAKSQFSVPLNANERKQYQSFVEQWHQKCLNAISS